MKKGGVLIFIITILISVGIVSATHITTTSDGGNSFSVNEGNNFNFQINITNNGVGPGSEITQVNITLPNILKFRGQTETTDAFFQNFVNTSNILSWSNFIGNLINEDEQKYFKFVANATTQGSYIITVTTLNSTGEYSSSLSLEVLGISCNPDWDCTSWSECINDSQTRTCNDLNLCGDETGKPIEILNCSISKTTFCIQNWTCTNWSDCLGETQIRICNDLNLCGNESGKPIESQSCQGSQTCNPIYTCTDWQPEECKKEEIQTRTCTDSNNCNKDENKPDELRTCKADSKLFFTIIVILIITSLIFIGITLMMVLKKQKSETNKKNKPTNPRPIPRRYLYKLIFI